MPFFSVVIVTDKGCGESRVVHGHRVAQHPLVAVGDSDNNLYTTFFADLYIRAKPYHE